MFGFLSMSIDDFFIEIFLLLFNFQNGASHSRFQVSSKWRKLCIGGESHIHVSQTHRN
jgi:hypothetical protein